MFLWELLLATIIEYPNNGGLNCKVDEYFQNQNIWRKASSDMVNHWPQSTGSLLFPHHSLSVMAFNFYDCYLQALKRDATVSDWNRESSFLCLFLSTGSQISFPGPHSYPIRGRSELGHMDMSSCWGIWESKYLLPRFCSGVSKT